MFVEMNEIKNAGTLFRIKLSSSKGSLGIGYGAILGMCLSNLIFSVTQMLQTKTMPVRFEWTDLSPFLLFGLFFGVNIFNMNYRGKNQVYDMYPQTNNSRFLSYELWVHFLIVSFLLVFVACYLIQYGVCRAIAAGKSNVRFPYTFDPVYVLAGFAAWFIYLALVTGILTLFSVLIRKFRLYAVAFFSTLLICAFASPEKTIGVLAPAVEFFTKENRIEIFLLKGILVWVILLFASIILNKYTVYYRSRLRITRHTVPVTIFCLLLAGGFGSFFAISSMRVYTETENNVSDKILEEISEPTSWDKELVIDISSLPKGSDIKVKTNSNITLVPDNYDSIGSHWDENAFFEYADGTRIEVPEGNLTFELGHELENIQGDTLTLHYGFYHEMINGIESGSFMNPSLEARLEGSTLYLDYNYEKNIKLMIIQIWPFMKQFDAFRAQSYSTLERKSEIWNSYLSVTVE